MNYIVTGGLGFIGRNLLRKLADTPHGFHCLDIISGDDVCDPIDYPRCDVLIHLAAFTNVRESFKHPERCILENTAGMLNCLEFARENNSKVIFASSMGAPYALSPYSASKLACEHYCKSYAESYGVDVTVLRFSSVYGPLSAHKQSVIASFIKACMHHRDITIYGDGEQVRDFIHVDDVTEAILSVNGNKLTRVTSGKSHSVLKIAKMIQEMSAELLDFKPVIFHDPANPGEITDMASQTNISAQIALEDGLYNTFKWYKENYKC